MIFQFMMRQMTQIEQGGVAVIIKKFKKLFIFLLQLPIAISVLLFLRLIRRWLLIRWGCLVSSRIGPFATSPELYLCRGDAGIDMPKQRHIDLFFLEELPLCNQQMLTMWKRVLRIFPSWLLRPLEQLNKLIPGGEIHQIRGETWDRHNLFDRYPSHLEFTLAEESRGKAGLNSMGIPADARFICFMVRDSAYLNHHLPQQDWNHHNYRDVDIQNYVLAAETLAERGYFVIRMGAKVNFPLESKNSRVINYATNGMRDDFMDIYLGAKCWFCISSNTGIHCVPNIFRRPVIYTNDVPFGVLNTWFGSDLILTKRHFYKNENRELSFGENFQQGVAYSPQEYEAKAIELKENTPEEIRDVALEMVERLEGTWQPHKDDEGLQKKFWDLYPINHRHRGVLWHGEVRARFGAVYLRNNQEWLK